MDAGPVPRVTVRAARCTATHPVRRRALDAIERMPTGTGLPARAILVVRHIQATVGGDPPRVGGYDLSAVARAAARPAAAPPPVGAEAVVFADEVEMLACLVDDMHTGRALRWWWQSLFDPRRRWGNAPPPAATLATAFAENVAALPAAAARRPGAMAAAAATLDPPMRWRLLAAAAQAHAAPEIATAARQRLVALPLGSASSSGTANGAVDRPPGLTRAGLTAAATGSATVDHAAVFEEFVAPLVGLFERPAASRCSGSTPVERPPAADRAAAGVPPSRAAWTDATDEAAGDRSPAAVELFRPPADGHLSRGGGEQGESATLGPVVAHGDEGSSPGPAVAIGPHRWRTAYAGAVYLLALLEFLDLPSSADGPGEPGPWLSRWEVLELLISVRGADRSDGLFAALAELGADSAAADARWTGALGGTATGVLSVPRTAAEWPRRGAAAPVRAPDATTSRGGAGHRGPADAAVTASLPAVPADPPPPRPSERWARSLAELCTTLLRRVGLDWTIVARAGEIEVDDLRVTVAMRLDDIDIDVRRAGLDRDPGWVPALGRVVTLDFR